MIFILKFQIALFSNSFVIERKDDFYEFYNIPLFDAKRTVSSYSRIVVHPG